MASLPYVTWNIFLFQHIVDNIGVRLKTRKIMRGQGVKMNCYESAQYLISA